jgi:O-antigen ligase
MSEAAGAIPASTWPEIASTGRPTPWRGLVLLLVAVLTPLMAYVSQEGFVPTIAGAGALMVWPTLFRRRPASIGGAILLVLALWALVSLTWSAGAPRNPNFHKYGELQALTGAKLLLELALYGTFVAGATAVSEPSARRAALVLSLLLVAVAPVVTIEAFTQAAWFQWMERTFDEPMRPDWAARNVARATYFMAVLFWPIAHLLLLKARHAPLTIVLLFCCAVAAFRSNVDAPVAALAVSGVVYAAVRAFGRPAIGALVAGVLLYFLAAPFLFEQVRSGPLSGIAAQTKASWGERLRIWSVTDGLVLERPLLGWGARASRAFQPAIPMHPHDAALQIWLELGALGAALAAALWAWILAAVARGLDADRPMAAAAAAAASAYLTIGALSFDVWLEWWLALGALTAALCALVAKVRRVERESFREDIIPLA